LADEAGFPGAFRIEGSVAVDQYELYCLADPLFYDRMRDRQNQDSDFALASMTPDGWDRLATDTWVHYAPQDARVPLQGWKIHLSARQQDAERAIQAVWDYCVPRGIAFKFLRGTATLLAQNSKAAVRGASGKLVTVYPRDDEELEVVLKDLDEQLSGVQGPYILSDLRYGEGPLFVRYGGFVDRRCIDESGERVPAIEDPDGRLVPDRRGTTFAVPDWVTLPAFLEPHLAARNAVTTTGLPYAIKSVLHFSNGGGVYLADDTRTGDRVVLKEARPHAGLDTVGRDAVARLRHERDILERLVGLDVVPAVRDYFTLGEHEFLVQEFVDGNPLQRLLVHRYPLTSATCSAADLKAYTDWVTGVCERVEDAVRQLHARGVVFGDLHPDNILLEGSLEEPGRLVLIDFEVATLVADDSPQILAHPAFVAPRGHQGTAVDEYALACLLFGLFAPQATILLPSHGPKIDHLAQIIVETFPVAPERIEAARARIRTGDEPWDGASQPGEAPRPETVAAMHRAILASATPERDDRLHPGDVAQFLPCGGLNLAHGAAGVLYALRATGGEVPAEHVDWLARRAADPRPGSGLGLYDGLTGVACALRWLGREEAAHDLLGRCLAEAWEGLASDLFSGLAGLGLALFDAGSWQAWKAVQICADRLGGPEDVPEISGNGNPRGGLMYGSSGPALLFLHGYERSGDPALLDLAAVALRQDLRRCVRGDDGSLQLNEGWRKLPYLAEGSLGIGMVLARYLAHRPDPDLAAALAEIRLGAAAGYYVQPGLFAGRAGVIAALAAGLRPGATDPDPLLDQQIAGLRWHALPFGGGIAFPGDRLLRLSMDLATGTAGALLAVGLASLPFLGPPNGTETPARPGSGGSSLTTDGEEV
jgi:serine/threonine protein kinase